MSQALLLALVAIGLTGCGGSPAKPPAGVAKQVKPAAQSPASDPAAPAATPENTSAENDARFTSPEATFLALRKAAMASDTAQIRECFTPGGAVELTGAVWMIGTYLREGLEDDTTDERAPAFMAAIGQAFEKHVPADLPFLDQELNQPNEKVRPVVRALAAKIRQPEEFFAAVFKALDDYSKQPDGSSDTSMKDSEMLDLQIDGDTATATVTKGLFGFDDAPIQFVRERGQWKIETLGDFGLTTD